MITEWNVNIINLTTVSKVQFTEAGKLKRQMKTNGKEYDVNILILQSRESRVSGQKIVQYS